MYKVFLKFPDALRPAFPRLKEKLEDPDPGLQCSHFLLWLLYEKWNICYVLFNKNMFFLVVLYIWIMMLHM